VHEGGVTDQSRPAAPSPLRALVELIMKEMWDFDQIVKKNKVKVTVSSIAGKPMKSKF
jgi:hypothetical protein